MTGQTEFATALLDPAQPTPEGLQNPFGGPAAKRFDVYRNNVAVSLTEALETGFPTIAKLVGMIFFKAMAGSTCAPTRPPIPGWRFTAPPFPAFWRALPRSPICATCLMSRALNWGCGNPTMLQMPKLSTPPGSIPPP